MLVQEPYNLSFEQIARLTDHQISRILFHPRNEDGTLRRGTGRAADLPDMERDDPLPPEQVGVPDEAWAAVEEIRGKASRVAMPPGYVSLFWSVWAARGASPADILARWRESLKVNQAPEGETG